MQIHIGTKVLVYPCTLTSAVRRGKVKLGGWSGVLRVRRAE
jgi:hypothetical protein